ncbi:MAG: F0F1 ATP synthase subunit delta, partial [Gammaproteobacteria bacterium]
GVVAEAAGKALDSQGTNFVQLLAEKDRLTLVPEIHTLFEELRAASENRVDVELRSPSEVADAQKQRIAEALKRRFGREVELHCVKDESLLGGAVIRAGDTIIDASVRGKLERLASEMSL